MDKFVKIMPTIPLNLPFIKHIFKFFRCYFLFALQFYSLFKITILFYSV